MCKELMALGFHHSSVGTSLPKTWSLHPPPSAASAPRRCLWQLGAAPVPSLWLSRLTWERDQSRQSSGCSQALSVWLRIKYSLENPLETPLPGALPWTAHQPVCSELVGQLPCQQKLGLRKRRGSEGAGKESRKRETKHRARLGGIVTRKSDQKPHSCTQAAWG